VYAEKVPRSTDLSTDNSAKIKTCKPFSNLLVKDAYKYKLLFDMRQVKIEMIAM